MGVDFQYGDLDDTVNGVSNNTNHDHTGSNNGMSMQSTGGQQWLLVSQQAEQKLETARNEIQLGMDTLMKKSLRRSEKEGIKFVDAFLQVQHEIMESQFGSDSDDDSRRDVWGIDDRFSPDSRSVTTSVITKGNDEDNDLDSILESPENRLKPRGVDWSKLDDEGEEEYNEDRSPRHNNAPEGAADDNEVSDLEACIQEDINTTNQVMVEGSMTGGHEDDSTVSNISNREQKAAEKGPETVSQENKHVESEKIITVSKRRSLRQSEDSESVTSSKDAGYNRGSSGKNSPDGKSSLNRERTLGQRNGVFDSSEDETTINPDERSVVEIVEAEKVDVLPMYLIGGVSTAGFNRILGNALSLLYVARHGLKENELWSILCTLPSTVSNGKEGESDQNSAVSVLSNSTTHIPMEVKALLQVCYYYREQFLTVWKSNDLLRTGRLTFSKLLTGMQMVNPEFSNKDLDMLLSVLNIKAATASVSSMRNHKTVDYEDLCDKIKRGNRVAQMSEVRKKNNTLDNSEIESINDMEDPLFNPVQLGEELDGFAVASVDDLNGNKSLGPVLEEGLLSALCALGVSHSPDDQVIILPCENEQLRSVVLERYILANNGTTNEWHMRLIQFFQRKKNSLRRCEELPWHLKICRRWHSLRNILSDLKTFNIMAQGHLRDELLNYWMTLTHQPLYTTDQAEQDANNASRVQLTENMKILSELDSAAALHLNAKDIKKQLLKDCVANFDIVEEMEKTVEAWITRTGPSGTKIAKMIMFIAKFLAEYCRLYETSTPPFLRLGMEQKFFTMFNIELEGNEGEDGGDGENVLPIAPASNSQLTVEKKGSDDDLKKVLSKATPVGNNVTNLSKENAHLYMYYRWIWIHFPWLAMPSSSAHLASLITKNGKAVNVLSDEGNSTIGPSGTPTKLSQIEANSQLNMSLSNIPLRVGEAGMNNSAVNTIDAKGKNSSQLILDPLTTTDGSATVRRVANRSWGVHKLDPSKSSVIKPSESRNAALMRTAVSSSSSLDAIESYSKHVLETKHTNVITGEESGNPVHNPRDKFRSTMADHMDHMAKIPFSKSSTRSIRKGTLFPSVEENFTAKHTAKMKELDEFSRSASARYGGVSADEEEKHTFKDEMEHIRKLEKLKALNARDNSAIPSADAKSVIQVLENEKAGKLRKAFDQVVEIRRHKESQLREMNANFVIRQDVDDEVLATLRAADDTMNKLEDRYVSLQSALTEAKTLNEGYGKLISFLNVNQPSTETHMTSLEQEVHLARQQCRDLKAYRMSVYEDIERLEKITIKNLKSKVQSTKSQRTALRKKLKVQRSINHEIKAELDIVEEDLRILQQANNRSVYNSSPVNNIMGAISKTNTSATENNSGEHIDRHVASALADFAKFTLQSPSVISVAGALNQDTLSSVPPTHRTNESSHAVNEVSFAPDTKDMEGSSDLNENEGGRSAATTAASERRSYPPNRESFVLSSKGEEMKKRLMNLYSITGTNSPEDFLSVFKNSQRLFESMKSHQILAESRLSQLRGEYNELQGMLGETIYVQSEVESQDDNKTANSSEREMRYMDQRMFQAEMRMNQNARRTEKSVLNINEVRTGVVHIAELLTANESLLQNLPSSNPPVMKSESGIAKMLAWCEERVLAINEALVLDASKPNQMDDSKPLCDRQTDLAQLIQALLNRGNPSSDKYKNRLKVVKSGSISKDILGQLDGDPSNYDENTNGIRINSYTQSEVRYSEEVDQAMQLLESRAIVEENAASNAKHEDRAEQMLKLLNEAVVSQESKAALRRANKLANRKQGRRAGFGWTIEELLRADAEVDINEAKSSKVTKKITENHSTDIVERGDIKSHSRSVLRMQKLQQQQLEEEQGRLNGNGNGGANGAIGGNEISKVGAMTKDDDDKA